MINKIEVKLGYSYMGLRKGFHAFKKYHADKDIMSYHYFEETTCNICGKPYMRRKGYDSKAHVECNSRAMVAKRYAEGVLGRPRKRILSENF